MEQAVKIMLRVAVAILIIIAIVVLVVYFVTRQDDDQAGYRRYDQFLNSQTVKDYDNYISLKTDAQIAPRKNYLLALSQNGHAFESVYYLYNAQLTYFIHYAGYLLFCENVDRAESEALCKAIDGFSNKLTAAYDRAKLFYVNSSALPAAPSDAQLNDQRVQYNNVVNSLVAMTAELQALNEKIEPFIVKYAFNNIVKTDLKTLIVDALGAQIVPLYQTLQTDILSGGQFIGSVRSIAVIYVFEAENNFVNSAVLGSQANRFIIEYPKLTAQIKQEFFATADDAKQDYIDAMTDAAQKSSLNVVWTYLTSQNI